MLTSTRTCIHIRTRTHTYARNTRTKAETINCKPVETAFKRRRRRHDHSDTVKHLVWKTSFAPRVKIADIYRAPDYSPTWSCAVMREVPFRFSFSVVSPFLLPSLQPAVRSSTSAWSSKRRSFPTEMLSLEISSSSSHGRSSRPLASINDHVAPHKLTTVSGRRT